MQAERRPASSRPAAAADVETLVLPQASVPAPKQADTAAVDLGAYDGLPGCAEGICGGCDC